MRAAGAGERLRRIELDDGLTASREVGQAIVACAVFPPVHERRAAMHSALKVCQVVS
jgi:hypothetical protein